MFTNTFSVLRQVHSLFHSEFFQVGSATSSFYVQYILLSSRSFIRWLGLFPLLPVPSIFPSIICFRRHFPCTLWRIQLTFLRCIAYRMSFLSLTLCSTYLLHGAESFWETNWFAASQENPRISRNPKVHYRTHKRPPSVVLLFNLIGPTPAPHFKTFKAFVMTVVA